MASTQFDPEADQDSKIKQIMAIEDMIERQFALTEEGFKRILQGKMNGASGLAAVAVALQGGVALDFTPIPDFSQAS